MKREVVVGVLTFLLGMLVSYLWIQETQVKPLQERVKVSVAPPTEKRAARWETLAEGLQALRLWEAIGPDWPQIAILQLSSERYKELQQNAKAFVDKHKIFHQDVQPLERCTELEAPPPGYSGSWIVAAPHRLMSRMRCAAFPAERTAPPTESK